MRPWAAAALAVLALAVLTPQARASTGPYLDSVDWAPIDDATVVGPEGVPQTRYSWGLEDNPVTICQWGLQHWSWWTDTHRQADLDAAVAGADWLVRHQRADGAWEFDFDFNGAGVSMQAPWISAMAQGQAMSLLVRAYSVNPNADYLDAAERALDPLQKTIADGGVAADFDGVTWLEEYPADPSQHVLNGFEYTLIGLADLGDESLVAQQLLDAGAAALEARIGRYDLPAEHTQYYAALGAGRVPSRFGYPKYHAVLTRALAALTGRENLADWAARWEDYLTWRPPLVVRPAVVPPPAVAQPPPVAAPPVCRFRGHRVTTRGRLSCRIARRALRAYLRHGDAPHRWRCHRGTRVICRRGQWRVSAPRYAASSSSAHRAQV